MSIFNEFIKKISNEDGRNKGFKFEIFVLYLLKHHLEKQGKILEIPTSNHHDIGYDALAPYGFDNFKGKTLIEIKYVSNRFTNNFVKHFIQKLADNIFKKDETLEVLIIFANATEKEIESLNNYISDANISSKIKVWGNKEIDDITIKYEEKVNEIVNNLFALQLQSTISETTDDWKSEREIIIEKLKECYKGGQFSLLLGAGVSSSAGMPNWDELLQILFVESLISLDTLDSILDTEPSNIKEMASRLKNINNSSALVTARYLRTALGKSFKSKVKTSLYNLRDEDCQKDSELIKAIVKICTPKRRGVKVESIITYNFDDLIEQQLEESSLLYRSIYTENETCTPDELPIYHVHGFLPENSDGYDKLDNSTLVFSEEGYHQMYSDPYHWSNLIQLNSFRENNCLMIGLSLIDPNLRRLLDISSKNIIDGQHKHFAFIKRLSEDEFFYKVDEEKNKTPYFQNLTFDNAKEFLKRHIALNELLMKELGVTIIWYESHNDIPTILEKITKSC
ncbi:MAG: SIR2 family protein [Methylococcaceae bacterium]